MSRPSLIAFMPDISARTPQILAHLEHIAALPFDGMVVNLPATSAAMRPGTVLIREDLEVWLEPLAAFNEGRENWILVQMDRPGGLWDDSAWAQAAANLALLAEVAHETGFAGILIDNEEYYGRWDNWPQEHPPGDRVRGLAAAEAQAQARGAEIMAAIAAVWPEAAVAFAHGPYVSVPRGAGAPEAIGLQVGPASLHELAGPFFTGFLSALGPGNRLIDGGELYALRSAAEFRQSQEWREGLGPRIPWDIPDALRSGWSARVETGHLVYTDAFPDGNVMTPHILTRTLLNALDWSEGAVFLYTEPEQFGWFAPGTLPADWLRAVTLALSLKDATQQGGRGSDRLAGSAAPDRLIGGAGGDHLSGRAGADSLQGGAGADVLAGGAGADTLDGGRGADLLAGGPGADVFVLSRGGGTDRVADFDPALDRVDAGGARVRVEAHAEGTLVRLGGAALLLEGLAPGAWHDGLLL